MSNAFQHFNLHPDIMKSLDVLNYHFPTPIQSRVIPALLNHKDLIIKSKTGSGKTAAFSIPIIQSIKWDQREPQVLVLTPTRELAIQVKEDMFNIGRFSRIKVEAVYGKSSFESQVKQLKQRTHVIVSTPGRLIDHVMNKTVDLSHISTLVIDEADELLRMGFIDEVESIIHFLPLKRLTVLLSATMPTDIETLSHRYMENPELIVIEDDELTENKLKQYYYQVEQHDKLDLIDEVLIIQNPNSAIIFCNTKQAVDEVCDMMKDKEYLVQKIHGDLEQKDRLKVMNDFKHGLFRYLVATDVAARGLDIDSVSLVINYDIPYQAESYVHRIGRSARAGKEGLAITFVSHKESHYLDQINTYTNQGIVMLERKTKDILNHAIEAFQEKQSSHLFIKMDKGYDFKEDIMKLHINAGKKTKMRASDIVGTICAIPGLTAKDIGVITLLDISTFVEILNKKGELVYETLQTMPIKGRLRVVSKANKSEYELAYEASKALH
jgi:ATP-dependent RNA helicase DeaD